MATSAVADSLPPVLTFLALLVQKHKYYLYCKSTNTDAAGGAATFAWELRLHLAAKTIQAFYRDLIDRQWAKYVNKGNLQVLVGRQAARELSHLHKAQLTGTHTTGTLKPPIKKFYSTGVLSRISILNDGVPIREPLRALKVLTLLAVRVQKYKY